MADDVLHHSHVRMRVTGSGVLNTTLYGLYDSFATEVPPSQPLAAVTMATSTPKFVQFNANFEQQYAQIEVSTDIIDAYFYITKIVTYVKPTAVAYPM